MNDITISEIAAANTPVSWEPVFENAKNELSDIDRILSGKDYYPLKEDIFAALHKIRVQDVNVVIVGQDPYHQAIEIEGKVLPRATGLSFSVRRQDVTPSSLKNIFKELKNTVPGYVVPNHGNLEGWCEQGVLLLNTCLTVYPNQAGSHKSIWLGFVKKVIKEIEKVNPNCIFVLWGREAQNNVKPMLGSKAVVLEAAHPSGFSAARGFFGCNHFNKINEILSQQKKPTIKWSPQARSEKIETEIDYYAMVPTRD